MVADSQSNVGAIQETHCKIQSRDNIPNEAQTALSGHCSDAATGIS